MAKDKKKKPQRPKAVTPRGFRDYFGEEVAERRVMLDRICEVYHHYGFDPLESSAVETVEALGKFLPDVDRPNDGIFAWQDDDEAWLGLRYDLTAPLARVVAQHRMDLPNPYRRYAVGPVWRNEKPGPGRFRQFYQCDADTVGTPTVAADAEICMMTADAFEALGIAREDVIIRINNRKVLNGVMEAIGLGDQEAAAATRGIVLRAIDKLDRLGDDGVRALLGAGRKDESGDFTKGAELSVEQADQIMGFVTAGRETSAATCARLSELVGGSDTGPEGVRELETIAELLEAQGYQSRAIIDPSVVRGLDYYTGPVYEAELTFEITDEDGQVRQFGSVAGAGAMTTWSSGSPARPCRRPASRSGSTGCWPRSMPRAAWTGRGPPARSSSCPWTGTAWPTTRPCAPNCAMRASGRRSSWAVATWPSSSNTPTSARHPWP